MNIHNELAENIFNSLNPGSITCNPGFSPISERQFWDSLDDGLKTVMIRRAEECLKKEYPMILISDYRRYHRDGNRSAYEDKYFGRRLMLVTYVIAECMEDKGRFLDRILDGLYLIMEETSWCLPAHNTYVRDTPALEIPSEERPVIDLFAAETAEIIGITEYLLRDRLSDIDESISAHVNARIVERILKPYLNVHFWWMGNGLEPMCNWTPWITQNVLLAVFTRPDGLISGEDRMRALGQAAASVDYFLDEYGPDGCCNEGAQYYSHAGLCLFGCIDVMNRITGDAFAAMYEDQLIKNVAAYITRMDVGNGDYINYADCSPFPGKRTVRDYVFALKCGNEGYASFAAADYRSVDDEEKLMPEEQNLYYHLLQLEWHDQMMKHPAGELKPEDFYFPSTGLMIAGDEHFVLAVKAGDNADSHNHNDVGSVTLYRDGKPYLIDLGVETYTGKTFSDRRYEIWTMQSAYHNTVNFMPSGDDGCAPVILQHDGKEYAADKVETDISDVSAVISMDIAPAYPDKRVRKSLRRVSLMRGKCVRIEDSFDLDVGISAVMTLMTYEEPAITANGSEDGGAYRISVGELGYIEAEGIEKVEIERLPITDQRLRIAWKHDCFRILLRVSGDRASITCC